MDQDLKNFVALLRQRPAESQPGGSQPRRRRSSKPLWVAGVLALVLIAGGAAIWLAVSRLVPTSSPVATRPVPLPSVAEERAPPPMPPAPVPAPAEAEAPRNSASPPQEAMVPPAEIVRPPPEIAEPAPAPQPPAQPAWLRFAMPAPPKDGRLRIAVVIDDLGLDKKRTERAIALSGAFTLSFLSYATDLPRQTDAARRAGHELLVHVPMEPLAKTAETGPNQLEVNLSQEEVLRRLRWDLSRFDGYVGINNHMGSRFTADAASMRPVMEELQARGLLFLDSRTTAGSTGMELARALGVPHAGRDVFLDNEIAKSAIDAQLAELDRVARRNGSAIAIGHPHDQTLEALQRWLDELPRMGLVLVPLSAVVRDRGVTG